MLAKDINIVDIDPFQYENAWGALGRPAGKLTEPALVVFYHENRLVLAVHTEKGPVDNVKFRGPRNLDLLAGEHGVRRVICLETGALRRVASNAQARLKFDQTLWEQLIACKAAAKTELGAGIHIYPDPFKALPRLPDFALKALKWVFPRKTLVSLVVFDGDEIWTSLILGVRGGEICLVATSDSLEPMDLKGKNFKARVDRIGGRLAERWGKPTAGFYMDRVAFEQLIAGPKPLQALARLTAGRWIFVKPFPQRLKLIFSLAKLLKF